MKYGKFITTEKFCGGKNGYCPWESQQRFNCHEMKLEPDEGILTVKKIFEMKKGDSLRIRSSALGVFEIYLNGSRIGHDEMKPGWTDYRCRVFEIEYSTENFNVGENLFVAEVSSGWWSGRISFGYYGLKTCAFACELEIIHADGSSDIIPTDESWDAAVCGPVMKADIWDGEYYDARIPHASVNPGAHTWEKAVVFTDFTCRTEPFVGPHVRLFENHCRFPELTVYRGTVDNGSDFGKVNVTEKKSDTAVNLGEGEVALYDFRVNSAARPVFRVRAPKGTVIELCFAEMLNDSGLVSRGNDGPEGSAYIKNYRTALSRLVYVTGSDMPESFTPLHTFYGYRYIEVRASAPASILSMNSLKIGADLERTGHFSCSDEEINKLFENTVRGMRSNYLSVPTDCPQRDERLGWTGDTQMFSLTGAYICNTDGFMKKWLGDMRDSQSGFEGYYCDVVPRIWNNEGGSAWADAGIIVPYNMLKMYGDADLVKEHFVSMCEYMDALEKTSGMNGAHSTYGDWLAYDQTDKDYISIAYYANNARLLSEMAEAVGKAAEKEKYSALFEKTKTYFNEKYVKDGELTEKTQTACVLALKFGLVDGNVRENTVGRLGAAITENDNTLSSGFVGTCLISDVLTSEGLDGLAYNLLLQTKDPSWLYSVRNGATTVWERWNSYTYEKGFGDVGMNSFNHYAYGAVCGWLFSGVCGIRPGKYGFDKIIIEPHPDTRDENALPEGQKIITCAEAELKIPGGAVKSKWKRDGRNFTFTVTIPSGTEAEIRIPGEKPVVLSGGSRTFDKKL